MNRSDRTDNNIAVTTVGSSPQAKHPPLVTVVVPAYRAERFLADCIRSVQAQTEERWLLRIVDDGSPDKCGDIARAFAKSDSRISVIRRENGGFSAARNTALENVETPFVTFLDADDVILPDYIATLLEMQKGSADRISCLSHFDFPDYESYEDVVRHHHDFRGLKGKGLIEEQLVVMSPTEAMENILYQRILDHSAWGKLYPAHMVPAGIFRPGIGYEDMDAFYRIFTKATEIVSLPLPLYGYRSNPASYTKVFTERRADVLDVGERMVGYMSENYPSLVPAARSRLLSAFFNMYALASADKAPHPELLQRCWKGIRQLRREALTNRNVRLKNKIAVATSYVGGQPLLKILAGILY